MNKKFDDYELYSYDMKNTLKNCFFRKLSLKKIDNSSIIVK